jgi:hypothetical protein
MGTDPAQTVREIEQARERISTNIRELEDRLPAPAAVAKRAGSILFGGGAISSVVWFFIRRMRSKRAAAKAAKAGKLTTQAQTVVQLIPERWAQVAADGRGRAWAAGMGSAMILLEMAELRRLRSLNKALSARL